MHVDSQPRSSTVPSQSPNSTPPPPSLLSARVSLLDRARPGKGQEFFAAGSAGARPPVVLGVGVLAQGPGAAILFELALSFLQLVLINRSRDVVLRRRQGPGSPGRASRVGRKSQMIRAKAIAMTRKFRMPQY